VQLNLFFPAGMGLKKAGQQIVVLKRIMKLLLAGPMELGCCEARNQKNL
jgi:hypothetical protein